MRNHSNKASLITSFLGAFCLLFAIQSVATDEILLRRVPGIYATHENYTFLVLKAALDSTKANYGPYKLDYAEREMTRSRTFNEMQEGERVNVADTPVTDEWSEKLIRVPIPVQRGILSYRLFLVTKENENLLAGVETIEDLKKIRQGSGSQWAITGILKTHNFNIVEATSKQSLLNMLAAKRFDIFGRGINEIFYEVGRIAKVHPNIVIDKHIALYSYLPTYFHVSPKHPRIAERIGIGLRNINATGEHERLFVKHHEYHISQAGLKNRKVLMLRDKSVKDELWENDVKFLFTTPDMK